jgi:hypothetical protein
VATLAALCLLAYVTGMLAAADRPSGGRNANATAAAPTTTLPQTCADALALARLLVPHVRHLADAANSHVEVMEKLDLFLEGKPGGINGQQAYDQGAKQMATMAAHGPDAEVQARRFQEVDKRCPLR